MTAFPYYKTYNFPSHLNGSRLDRLVEHFGCPEPKLTNAYHIQTVKNLSKTNVYHVQALNNLSKTNACYIQAFRNLKKNEGQPHIVVGILRKTKTTEAKH